MSALRMVSDWLLFANCSRNHPWLLCDGKGPVGCLRMRSSSSMCPVLAYTRVHLRWCLAYRHRTVLAFFGPGKRALDHCASIHLGTIASNLRMPWRTARFYTLPLALSRMSLLSFPSSWPGTASSTLLPLSMPPGNLCHAGGSHLRRKASIDNLYVHFSRGIFAPRFRELVVCMQHSPFLVPEFRRFTDVSFEKHNVSSEA